MLLDAQTITLTLPDWLPLAGAIAGIAGGVVGYLAIGAVVAGLLCRWFPDEIATSPPATIVATLGWPAVLAFGLFAATVLGVGAAVNYTAWRPVAWLTRKVAGKPPGDVA